MKDIQGILWVSKKVRLTNQELKVMCLWISSENAKESAKCLDISPRTVDWHRGNIKEKFDASNFSWLKSNIKYPEGAYVVSG